MDFHQAFYEIDTDRSGEITRDELVDYMRKKNYKETFVQKWLSIFDVDQSGTITYEEYCTTLGLVPKDPEPVQEEITSVRAQKTRSAPKPVEEEAVTMKRSAPTKSEAPKRSTGDSKNDGGHSGKPRNSVISTKGNMIMRFSPARVIQKKALYRYKPATVRGGGPEKSKPQLPNSNITKPVNGENNGNSRTVPVIKAPRSYPSQQISKKNKRRVHFHKDNLPRLRNSIRPGTILIIVSGRHRGKRVIFLKQMKQSGLLLVSGPFKLNGCPLRRVNQRFVIATSVQIDVSQVEVPERLTDSYFRRIKARKSKEDGDIFKKESSNYELTEERKEDQKAVDRALLSAIGSREDSLMMKSYLRTLFSIKNGDYPHMMQF